MMKKFNTKPQKCYIYRKHKWCKCQLNSPKRFDFIRSINRGGTLIRIGCPKGKSKGKGKKLKCTVSSKTQSIWRRNLVGCTKRTKRG